ncbi:hypothetical protein ULO1_00780 [Carboxydocella sp. ULO1]|nr:hypothetical protein ULO1_00780 [Carboxydocella sp. ULO1]
MNENQLVNLVNVYQLKVNHIIARAIEEDTGLRATISLEPTKDEIIDKQFLKEMILSHKVVFKRIYRNGCLCTK